MRILLQIYFLSNLRIRPVSLSVIPRQAFPAWCNVTLSLIGSFHKPCLHREILNQSKNFLPITNTLVYYARMLVMIKKDFYRRLQLDATNFTNGPDNEVYCVYCYRVSFPFIACSSKGVLMLNWHFFNGRVRFKKCKQMLESQHLHFLRDIWWSMF
jgi:hypothetical protein